MERPLNLGCPNFCKGFLCVDKFPKDKNVLKADVYEYLQECADRGVRRKSIFKKNLLEHLGNPLDFLVLCCRSLEQSGTLTVITDNAEFLPYYIPLANVGTGLGGHSTSNYALGMNHSVHFTLYTKLHLGNLLREAGFENKVRRIPQVFFARLEAKAVSP